MQTQKFNITGMTCAACQANVTRCVSKLEGVEEVNVSLLANQMTTSGGGSDGRSMLERQQAADQIKYGIIIVSTLPLLVVYPFLQKYFNKGVMIGAVKG